MDEEAVGVAALKPVDAVTAEIKRVYVRPAVRGHGLARGMMDYLLSDARIEGYRRVRLESARFMIAAHALYRSYGFVETTPFDGSEAASVGLGSIMLFMELQLQ
ncbi:acetyltransferase [Rhodococcus sp. SC4]|nr:acetyltransferase [Rhodococcus sp. SC4]